MKNLLKFFFIFLVLEFTTILGQTTQSSINLKQILLDANYQHIRSKKINNSEFSKTLNTNQNLINHNDYYFDEVGTLSSSSNDMFRIQQFDNDTYTGAQDIKIPLFSIQEGDINVPINLIYYTSGIKVDQKASEVGLGWSLIKGPQVNRKINIVNDWFETHTGYDSSNSNIRFIPKTIGYFRKVRENLPLVSSVGNIQLAETLPDEYSVGLKDKMRKFIFTTENNPVELTKTGIKIIPTVFSFPSFSSSQPKDFSKFNIIDNDGLKYTFVYGGVKRSAGEVMELESQSSSAILGERSVSDWKVSNIEDVLNNRYVSFEYIVNSKAEEFVSISENSSILVNGGSHERSIASYNPSVSGQGKFYVNYNLEYVESKKYVSKILYSEGSLVFNYDTSKPDYILKSIEHFDKQNKLIKKYTFNYAFFGCIYNENDLNACSQRLKLISLEESNKGLYEFSYNNLPLYSYTSTKHDFLGYHTNGQIDDNGNGLYYYPGEKEWSILPYNLPIPPKTADGQFERQKIKFFSHDQFSMYNLKVLPSTSYMKAGVLEKIKFPTGGEQFFNYEMNDFLLFGKYEVQGAGLRIKESYLKENNKIEKRIRYEYKEKDTGKSSGLLLSPPFIGYPLFAFDLGTDFTEIMDEQDSFILWNFSLYNKTNSTSDIINGSIVGYGRVVQKYDDDSYDEFIFKNDNQNYDVVSQHFSYNSTILQTPNDSSYGNFKVNNSADLIKYKNFDIYGNGNLVEKNTYNSSSGIVNKISNIYRNKEYLTLDARFPMTTVYGRSSNDGMFINLSRWNYGTYKVKYSSYFNDLISSTKISYFQSGNQSENVNYTYINDYSNQTRKVVHSNGKITEKRYLFDSNYSFGSPEYNLQNFYNNIYAKESEKIEQNGKILNKQVIKYNDFLIGQNVVPKVSEIYNETLNGEPDNSFKIISYNEKGKIVETLSNNGIPSVTIWGYNNSLPIANIIGASYSQVGGYVSDIITKSNLDIDNSSEQNLSLALDAFRNNNNFSNFQITTYTHNPLIGVTSVTYPNGIKEFYKYDNANRLFQVIDQNGNIVKEYKYNHKH
ncbi:hypothetical protein [Chryseobacterium sp. NKUCC03_KSP]|uniref:hypothetical protein n=1 Tax=Chryseobacterium sp. NKUCC03_KSP TaxID=2842125 RepID=UPI001C5A691B|nr:hypothetical protein [Chryseobacterium sp. NKUCC03_KSP]MBW3524741.1 hypothetical protein [Chryseobacterium sp. NKUCC03_KSP]